jgi:hypothetical protein
MTKRTRKEILPSKATSKQLLHALLKASVEFEWIIKKTAKKKLLYRKDHIEWVAEFIEKQRKEGMFKQKDVRHAFILHAGAWLGECLKYLYCGKWKKVLFSKHYQWGIQFKSGEKMLISFPFLKIRKQIDQGIEESIVFELDSIEHFTKLKAKKQRFRLF